MVEQLLDAGADANVKDNDSRTPLSRASWCGHDAVVQRLLDAGADANEKGNDGWTPLYRASEKGYDTVVQRLLKSGAKFDWLWLLFLVSFQKKGPGSMFLMYRKSLCLSVVDFVST